jgi:hypothetical protein
MTNYRLELGEDVSESSCHCCNEKSNTGHGFLYKNNDAYGVYYVGWAEAHEDRKITVALALGEWGDDATSQDRICFGLELYEEDDQLDFHVIDPEESPWDKTELLGEMLSRELTLNHQMISEIYELVEFIARNHPAVKSYLHI